MRVIERRGYEDWSYTKSYDSLQIDSEHECFDSQDGPFVIDGQEGERPPKPKIFIRGARGGRRRLYKKTFKQGVLCNVED